MRLVTFEVATEVGAMRRVGALIGAHDDVVDLNLAFETLVAEDGKETRPREYADFRVPSVMLDFLRGGTSTMEAARETIAFVEKATAEDTTVRPPRGGSVLHRRDAVRLLAPVPRPNSMREFATYYSHGTSDLAMAHGRRQFGSGFKGFKMRSWFDLPQCYKGNCSAVSGPNDDMFWPRYTDRLDPEMELGFYIGKEGRDISLGDAPSHIAGFTMLVDVSARGTGENMRLGPYKSKDFCNLMGPCLVTTDEFDETNARAWYRVDGEVMWEGNTGEPRNFLSHHLVAYASDSETLYPGDFFTGGTIGMQCAVDTGFWPQPGQVCEFEIEGIGIIRSTIDRPEITGGWPRTRMPGLIPIPDDIAE